MHHWRFARSATVLLALVLGAAPLAAKPRKPPPPQPPVPAWTWTGFYFGGNVGYSWGTAKTSVSLFDALGTSGATGSYPMTGILGGGQAGYNWQSGDWVFGLETDLQGTGQRGSGTFICGVALFCFGPTDVVVIKQQLDWFGTVRARLGWAGTTPLLFYVTGGLAYGDVRTTEFVAAGPFSTNTVKTGAAVGAGLEGHIDGYWTWKIEYLYIDLGTVASGTVPTGFAVAGPPGCAVAPCPVSAGFRTTFTDNILRLGINYKLP